MNNETKARLECTTHDQVKETIVYYGELGIGVEVDIVGDKYFIESSKDQFDIFGQLNLEGQVLIPLHTIRAIKNERHTATQNRRVPRYRSPDKGFFIEEG